MRVHPRPAVTLVVITLTVALQIGAATTNLANNGEFNTSLSGWSQVGPSSNYAWDGSRDAAGSPSSGSAKLISSGAEAVTKIGQCIEIPAPSAKYSLSGFVYLHSSAASSAKVRIGAQFFNGAGCTGSNPLTYTIFVNPTSFTKDLWAEISSPLNLPAEPPSTVRSVHFSIDVERLDLSAGSNTEANFDSVSITPVGGAVPTVSIDGPDDGFRNDLLSFAATCSTANLRTGWLWSTAGGAVQGQADASTIAVKFASPGSYSLSASHAGCSNANDSHQVTISSRGPRIVIGEAPAPIIQNENVSGGTTSFVLKNAGDVTTTISLGTNGTFFSQSPSQFSLAPGASQRVTATGLSRAAGVYNGSSTPLGSGVPSGATIPIQLLSAATAPPDVIAVPEANRVDVAGSGSSTSGSIAFTNSGSASLQGIASTTQPWIKPEGGVVSIGPGQTRSVNFTIDRTRRPDSDSLNGSVFGDLLLTWSRSNAFTREPLDSAPSFAAPVAVTDTVKPATGTLAIPPLGAGEIAYFIPGVGHVTGSVGVFLSDLSIVNLTRGESLPNLSMYFNPIGGSSSAVQAATLAAVIPNQPHAYADLVSSVFGSTSQLGSLQLRTASPQKIGLAANVFNASNPEGTFGTIIPTFRSDRGAAPGETIFLAGLRADATSHTNLYIQETSGAEVTVSTSFRGSSGEVLGTRTDTVPGFGLIQLGAVVPQGGVSAFLTNSGATGRFFAYATPVDKLSGDTWSVSDWPRQYGYSRSEVMIFPVAGAVRGANDTFFRTDVAILNTHATTAATGTLRYVSREGQVFDKPASILPRNTLVLNDVTGSYFGVTGDTVGYILWIPSAGEVVMTSRNYTTKAGESATFGSAVPALAISQSLRIGDLRRMAGIEDAALDTIQKARPASFRTNFGLVETTGNAATVRVTLRYDFAASLLAQGRGSAFAEYALNPNQFLQVNNLARAILGASREDELGDLRNVEVDVEVVGGSGAVMVFVSSIDNGTGDSLLRTD
ncbi:MAG: hypothetical protein HYU52_14065 [Acidobacteria bacterium]|nr:hypothetical protein [Acidobacteriota bacterium]